jgi:hypothetical protein
MVPQGVHNNSNGKLQFTPNNSNGKPRKLIDLLKKVKFKQEYTLENNKERFLPIGFAPLVSKLGNGSLMNPINFAKSYKLVCEGFD